MSGTGASHTLGGPTRSQLRRAHWWEVPRLAALAAGQFLAYRPVRFGRLGKATKALWLLIAAFLTFASYGAWSGPDTVVVYSEEPPGGGSLPILRILLLELVILAPVTWVTIRLVGTWPAVILLVVAGGGATEGLRRHRRATAVLRAARRRGAPFLSWFASGREGAGRDLLEARCAVADGRQEWLCLESPEDLIGYYCGSGFTAESQIVPVGPIRRVYMERRPAAGPVAI